MKFKSFNGQHILSVTFTTNNEMAKVAQIRIDGADMISAAEPATWGLMIRGFGSMGALMRRRRAALA